MYIQIIATEGIQQIISKIKNSTFEIILRQGVNAEELSFQLKPELYQDKKIAIKLNFKSPSSISSSSDFDILEVTVKQSVISNIASNSIILSQYLKDTSLIPP